MYGTRKVLNHKLKKAFGENEPLALLVWSRDCLTSEHTEAITHTEADLILKQIGNIPLYDHIEEGVSSATVRELLAGLRASGRSISVPASLLQRVMLTAERALNSEEGNAWDAGKDTPCVTKKGQEDVELLRALIAA